MGTNPGLAIFIFFSPHDGTKSSDAASGWAEWVSAQPKFGSSANPFPTKRADYAHQITACPPKCENLTASLKNESCPVKILMCILTELI